MEYIASPWRATSVETLLSGAIVGEKRPTTRPSPAGEQFPRTAENTGKEVSWRVTYQDIHYSPSAHGHTHLHT